MDFFEHQERARRKTTLLVAYFFLAVILIIAALYAVFAYFFLPALKPEALDSASTIARAWWNTELFTWVAAIALGIIGIGTLYRIITLSQGGEAVARLLGARPVSANTTDLQERRLLNVVEEIALASGTPVPQVFVLDNEPSLNAFAAGFSTRDAVVAVTNGCLTRLTRDELQGVVAHEFSHILNGDMRLNLRLMGILNGILIIAIIGYSIFRFTSFAGRPVSGGRKKGGAEAILIIIGLAVMIIGYIGVFFGKLIKSAVSRQREFLADAASVQFTRNPDGLAGALKKIGGFHAGSRIQHKNAEEASHLFFANGLGPAWLNLMATHPPLVERIRRIDPAFSGDFAAVPGRPVRSARAGAATPVALADEAEVALRAAFAPGSPAVAPKMPRRPAPVPRRAATIPLRSRQTLESIGQPQAANLEHVTALLKALPAAVKAAAHEPVGARALVYGLLLSADEPIRTEQFQHLALTAEPDVVARTRELTAELAELPATARLPLVDVALTALRGLARAQVETFRDNLRALIEADAAISLFEYMLERMVARRLESFFGRPRQVVVQYYELKPLLPTISVLLSTLAYYGQAEEEQAARAFQSGAARLNSPLNLLAKEACGLAAVDQALTKLNAASPAIKKKILDACVACIAADGRTTVSEAELLRAVADSLDCPIPPFAPDAA
ncbi:MAG: M48 family metallopeptidase [Lentisphaerae bacterium]|nr:M48 family metallopeptidase [Lentisphaerota bacterium]